MRPLNISCSTAHCTTTSEPDYCLLNQIYTTRYIDPLHNCNEQQPTICQPWTDVTRLSEVWGTKKERKYLLGEAPLQVIPSGWGYPSKKMFHFVFCHQRHTSWNLATYVWSSQRNQSSVAGFRHGHGCTCYLCACLVHGPPLSISQPQALWKKSAHLNRSSASPRSNIPFNFQGAFEVLSCHNVFNDVNSKHSNLCPYLLSFTASQVLAQITQDNCHHEQSAHGKYQVLEFAREYQFDFMWYVRHHRHNFESTLFRPVESTCPRRCL